MRRRYIIIGGVVLLLSVALLSAAAYLLHYALQPEREAVADTWARLYREYPDTRPWHDSLVHCHALRDTTITAKDGTHLHAFYVRNPRSRQDVPSVLRAGDGTIRLTSDIARLMEGMNGAEPEIPFTAIDDYRAFRDSGFDFVTMAQSLRYAPASADRIMGLLAPYIRPL